MEEINYKIVLILLKQYFKHVDYLVTKEDILKYYFMFCDYVNKDNYISWQEVGSNYLIKNIFISLNPIDIFIQMDSLYNNIKDTLELSSPNIVINPLEVSSELAHNDVVIYFTEELGENFEYTDANGDTYYTEDGQEIFNSLFEAFYKIITENKI